MASILTLPVSAERAQGEERGLDHGVGAAVVTALTGFTLVVHGYHPYAEDGGLYLAGVKKLLHPELYPYWSEFVTEHLRFSIFAPMVAGLVRGSHADLMTVMFSLYVLSCWITLFAAWQLAARCYVSRNARCGAVSLLAAWLTLPVAGTSLLLMDPYVSARSLSTPCSLLALVGMLDFIGETGSDGARRWRGLAICVGALAVAAAMHPLMAAYALGCVLLLGCMRCDRRLVRVAGTTGLCVVAVAMAAILHWTAPAESTAYLRVALTRTYWFVSHWEWYEQFGLVAPLVILSAVGLGRRTGREASGTVLARVGVVAGAMALVVAVLFARVESETHLVARLQPLRMFQLVYVVMILRIGAALGERFLRRQVAWWVATFGVLGGVMLYAEQQTYANSSHIELPGVESRNDWEQAFVWIRRNTAVDARFAMDAHYITGQGEDAQSFRAIAERSAMPDYSKDGGEAAITPGLAYQWMTGEAAQEQLNTMPDATRVAVLRPLRVDWVILRRDADTSFFCAYENASVEVCRLP